MLAQIRKQNRKIATVLLLVAATLFVSCASKREQVALVKDPNEKAESLVPWNKQEKWETQSQFGGITDRR